MTKSIAFYIPDIGNWAGIGPNAQNQHALGGRETAVVKLSEELSGLGWTVTVYAPGGTGEKDAHGVRWILASNAHNGHHYDVFVSMERPEIFKKVRAKLNVMHIQCATPHGDYPIKALDKKIDAYLLLSHYQQWSLRSDDQQIDADKCVIMGNGVDLDRYDSLDVQTVPGRFVYSSSPDRGLYHILRWWPQLKARYSHITLRVFYRTEAMESYKWTHEMRSEWARIIDQGRHFPGVEYVGPVDQVTLAREQKQAELYVYPCDPAAPTETWCVTLLEAAAAGVPIVTSRADCLEEIYGDAAWLFPVPIYDPDWLTGIAKFLDEPEFVRQSVPRARKLAERYTWNRVARKWDAYLRRRLEIRAHGDDPEEALALAEQMTEMPETFLEEELRDKALVEV